MMTLLVTCLASGGSATHRNQKVWIGGGGEQVKKELKAKVFHLIRSSYNTVCQSVLGSCLYTSYVSLYKAAEEKKRIGAGKFFIWFFFKYVGSSLLPEFFWKIYYDGAA